MQDISVVISNEIAMRKLNACVTRTVMMGRYCMDGCMVVLQTLATLAPYLTSRRKSELMNYSPNGTIHISQVGIPNNQSLGLEDCANSLLDGRSMHTYH